MKHQKVFNLSELQAVWPESCIVSGNAPLAIFMEVAAKLKPNWKPYQQKNFAFRIRNALKIITVKSIAPVDSCTIEKPSITFSSDFGKVNYFLFGALTDSYCFFYSRFIFK